MKRPVHGLMPIGATLLLLAAGAAWARNPNCAGGIQYLTQAITDKQRGNVDDYKREISKAVQRLEQCSKEDPADYEAMGYLGWAYAEVDSMGPAGKAFVIAIQGMSSKGEKKKVEMVVNNRESFWATAFNKGIERINTAQALYNPYTKPPADAADEAARTKAGQTYDEAVVSLNKALALKPGDPRTLRNLGAVKAFMGDFVGAEQFLKQGLAAAPGDSDLTAALRSARTSRAGQLVQEKKFDEAVAYYQGLLKQSPREADLWTGLGDAWFSKARSDSGDAGKKASFKSAADAYAKAGELKPESSELPFNAAICYQNAGDPAAAEAQWRAALKIKPDDPDALSEMSSVLAEEKKLPEAIQVAQKAVALDPKNKERHRQLGAIYSKAQDNLHSKQSLLVYLALDKGKPVDASTDASGAAGKKVQDSMGKAEQIVLWEAEGQKYETWFYWSKGQAFHFGGGVQLEKSDWSAALASK